MNTAKDAKSKIISVAEDARNAQKSGEYINRSPGSIKLCGKSADAIFGCNDRKKRFMLVIPELDDVERFDGDAVCTADVYFSSKSIVWDASGIRFKLPGGTLVTSRQYEYIEKHGALPDYGFFGESHDKDASVERLFNTMCRKAHQAKLDEAKDILFLEIGSVRWTRTPATATKKAETVTSPILLCPISAEKDAKKQMSFALASDSVKLNTVLARELKLHGIDILSDVPDVIPFGDAAAAALRKIAEGARMLSSVEVTVEDVAIGILDSANEALCQLLEKNLDERVSDPMTRVVIKDMPYDRLEKRELAPYAVYPLLADDAQREALELIRAGESVVIESGPGSGKTQTLANAAATSVCGMRTSLLTSTKASALDALVKVITEDIGLGDIILNLNKGVTVSELVDRIYKVIRFGRVYLDPVRSRDLLGEVGEIEEFFEEYNAKVYDVIPELDMSLYQLIGEAIARDASADISAINVTRANYRRASRRLDELQENIDNTLLSGEFEAYLATGTTGDEETDELLSSSISALGRMGVDVGRFVLSNGISHSDISAAVKANMSRIIAREIISERGLERHGSVFLRAKYNKLTECYARLKSLYVGYVQQEAGRRIAEAVREDRTLIPMLDRIRSSKMTVSDFFKKYGERVLKLCPIVVGTSDAVANYLTDHVSSFDLILVDEASQVPIINVLPFLLGCRQLVVCGDSQQLDPTSFFSSANRDVYDENGVYDISRTDKSILHMVQGTFPTRRLLYHYRSKSSHLFTVSNKFCYGGAMHLIPDVYTSFDKLPPELKPEIRVVDVPFDPDRAAAAAPPKNVANSGQGRAVNPYLEEYSRRVAARMIEDVVACVSDIRDSTPEKSIGIITLNERYQHSIMDALDDGGLYDEGECLFVRSLENVQGLQADIIIIAIPHSRRNVKGALVKNISGFFNSGDESADSGYKRLNVLHSRTIEKLIVFTGFDYKEIKDTENSLYRLFTYLEYFKTGNISCLPKERRAADRTNERAAAVISGALGGKVVREKVGESVLTVDVAVMDNPDSDRYEVGFILPDRRLTANTLTTKINLLERAGWKVLPLSLVYLLEKTDAFAAQLPKLLANQKRLGSAREENFLVETPPAVPVTLEEIALRGETVSALAEPKDEPPLIPRITTEQFARVGIEDLCRLVCDDNIRDATQAEIDASIKKNPQALLVKIAQAAQRSAELGDLEMLGKLAGKAFTLYKSFGEGRACYLLAQLLRLSESSESEENQTVIRALLSEAVELNIIKEDK